MLFFCLFWLVLFGGLFFSLSHCHNHFKTTDAMKFFSYLAKFAFVLLHLNLLPPLSQSHADVLMKQGPGLQTDKPLSCGCVGKKTGTRGCIQRSWLD